MRVGELSKRSGVPVPTIKYYLREGLLPAGVLTSPNQAHYDDEHLRRLRLVRALVDVGGLSIAAVRDVLAAIDNRDESLHEKLGAVQEAISQPGSGELDPLAVEDVLAFVRRQGEEYCDVTESNVTHMLAMALSAARSVGHDHFHDLLDPYLEGLKIIAQADVEYVARRGSPDDVIEGMVVGTLIGDAVLKAVRRLAHTQASRKVIGDGSAD
ncbi:DNA-binding transcriptional MerR regulator [Lentzea atacamensis]|uniref:DNA-binding transcriptional MerR regulator n=2 Tax=Lentzea TaxID=165301 RepID=A0A316HHG7_9PSEU|nr:MerR family transcriptional regulator [Lentzea atacamensis]PWK79430.1 DNA-binding transcriptional MerR regulator [Lentzea atacamensis]RAS57966.1 DNA-binding transcriptional MerR regulator [Lentzea atacamensis]